jgi:hypothetical protein
MKKEAIMALLNDMPEGTRVFVAKDTNKDVDLHCKAVKSCSRLDATGENTGEEELICVLFY